MQEFFEISPRLKSLNDEVRMELKDTFAKRDEITEYNQLKVLKAFINNGVSENHFNASTGYGYGDRGREVLEETFAEIMGAEDSLIRHNFVSGTHTLSVALFGVLRPGDTVLSVTGIPYDTIHPIFGITDSCGSLKEFGVKYDQVDLNEKGLPDLEKIAERLKQEKVKMVYIQRSRGYTLRKSLSVAEIGEIVKVVREIAPETIVMVDNCYGEFVEKTEPTEVGADIIAGSLIKNPGGGIARTGGYIAGRKDLIEMCSYRLTTPATGKEVGATLGMNRELFMGVFHAPHVVGEAVKTAIFASRLFEKLGYKVTPTSNEDRADIIQALLLENEQNLTAFCQGIQSGSPVDAFVTPEAWDMPGYDSKVIMAAGTFTLGASVELSADAPIREPFAVWMQGGLNFHSGAMCVLLAAEKMLKLSNQ